jgi:hypothetical protein
MVSPLLGPTFVVRPQVGDTDDEEFCGDIDVEDVQEIKPAKVSISL